MRGERWVLGVSLLARVKHHRRRWEQKERDSWCLPPHNLHWGKDPYPEEIILPFK